MVDVIVPKGPLWRHIDAAQQTVLDVPRARFSVDPVVCALVGSLYATADQIAVMDRMRSVILAPAERTCSVLSKHSCVLRVENAFPELDCVMVRSSVHTAKTNSTATLLAMLRVRVQRTRFSAAAESVCPSTSFVMR